MPIAVHPEANFMISKDHPSIVSWLLFLFSDLAEFTVATVPYFMDYKALRIIRRTPDI